MVGAEDGEKTCVVTTDYIAREQRCYTREGQSEHGGGKRTNVFYWRTKRRSDQPPFTADLWVFFSPEGRIDSLHIPIDLAFFLMDTGTDSVSTCRLLSTQTVLHMVRLLLDSNM